MTYDNAKDNCAEKIFNGGKLFEPANWHENKLVATAFNHVWVGGGGWIGVNAKLKYESSGVTIPFIPTWYPGYAHNGLSINCVWVDKWAGRFGLSRCTESQPSICQQ